MCNDSELLIGLSDDELEVLAESGRLLSGSRIDEEV